MAKPIPRSAQRDRRRKTAPQFANFAQTVLYGETWGRSDLPRRSHALDTGMGRGELAELVTPFAFHAGWPAAISAAPVSTDVFEGREA